MKNAVIINNCEVSFEVVNGEVFTTSLNVASVFDKRHSDIIAKICELPKDEFNERNFSLVKYMDAKGELRPCYNLTRDGFSLLVMGFTGERAYRWKIEFIKAFNKMEEMIKKECSRSHLDSLNLQSKFTQVLQDLNDKSNEANEFKAKYYESLERENTLLRDKLELKKENLQKASRLSQNEKDEIIRLFKSGISQAQICRIVGRSDTAIRQVLRSKQ